MSGADLRGANLGKAIVGDRLQVATNLTINQASGTITPANLSQANLQGVDLSQVDMTGVKLVGTIMPDGTVHP
jgi:uncharacterized protein YjbI with pentapeptide repeats